METINQSHVSSLIKSARSLLNIKLGLWIWAIRIPCQFHQNLTHPLIKVKISHGNSTNQIAAASYIFTDFAQHQTGDRDLGPKYSQFQTRLIKSDNSFKEEAVYHVCWADSESLVFSCNRVSITSNR